MQELGYAQRPETRRIPTTSVGGVLDQLADPCPSTDCYAMGC